MADTHQGRSGAVAPHARRLVALTVGISVVADLLFGFLLGPHLPPGRMSSTAGSQQFDIKVLFLVAIPVTLSVVTYLAYAAIVWRANSKAALEPLSPVSTRKQTKIQVVWIATTTAIVLSMFVFGTIELIIPAGAGGGEGPNPIWTPASKNVLPIQVIGQQWKFTYRYPTFGGFETDQLMVPIGTPVAFHVTSLDVIHDFWAYQLGVKADANPNQDNVAFTTADQLGRVTVRCDELCGIWHGAMFDYGHVVTKTAFEQWATSTEASLASATKLLPPFAWTYTPSANGASGGYYPPTDQFSTIENYGANAASPSSYKTAP